MTPELFEQVRSVFLQAARLDSSERASFLDRECADSPELRGAVERLLKEDDRTGTGSSCAASLLDQHAMTHPEQIGGYRVLRVLGTGGMGIVYEAEQPNPRRRVALKVVRAAPWLDDLTHRLAKREAAALARLSHPSVAAIHEAGFDEGWQYFAMEQVEGLPLTEYAARRDLTLHERVRLFAAVCDGVQYAHQRGVIHRDLKPSNIFVTPGGQPKILDFGLAHIVEPDGGTATRLTAPGTLMGTPAYMSPEQSRGDIAALDARSDIYSLGVVLYELLTGRQPYNVSGAGLAQAAHIICETQPTHPAVVRPILRGDLSTVMQKALQKAPDARYASAAALADDLRRVLASEPILARPPSTYYLFRKLAARHKLPFAAVLALFFVLAGSAAGLGWLTMRLSDERDAATLARNKQAEARASSEAFVDVLSNLFNAANPDSGDSQEPSLRQVLDHAYAGLDDIENVVARARLMTILGHVYARMDEKERARGLLESAVAILRDAPGDNAKELADALSEQAFSGPAAEADGPATEALEIRIGLDGKDAPATAAAWNLRGEMRYYAGNFEGALADFAAALAIWENRPDSEPGDIASVLANCGATCTELGKLDEAESYLSHAVDVTAQLDDRGEELMTRENLAKLVWRRDPGESERQFAEIVSIARNYYHPNHPRIGWFIRNYAFVVSHTKGWDAAEPLFAEALAIHRIAYGDKHTDLAHSLVMLGHCHKEMGRLAEAAAEYDEALAIQKAVLGPENQITLGTDNALQQVRELQQARGVASGGSTE